MKIILTKGEGPGHPFRGNQYTHGQSAFDISPEDLGAVYHGGKSKVKRVDPDKLQSRDHGYYGEGFYVTSHPEHAKNYGRHVSQYKFAPDTKILGSELTANKAHPDLVKAVLDREWNIAKPRIQGNPAKEAGFRDYLESIKTSPPSWARAVYAYGKANGYDVIRHSGGEIVVLNPDKLIFEKQSRN